MLISLNFTAAAGPSLWSLSFEEWKVATDVNSHMVSHLFSWCDSSFSAFSLKAPTQSHPSSHLPICHQYLSVAPRP